MGNPDSERKHSRITHGVTLEVEGNYIFFINNELHQLLIWNGGGRTLCTVVAEFVVSLIFLQKVVLISFQFLPVQNTVILLLV